MQDTGQLVLASTQPVNVSAPLLLANGSSLSLAGRVRSVSPQHADVAGSTLAQIQLTAVPANLTTSKYTCLFLTSGQIQALEAAALQVISLIHLPRYAAEVDNVLGLFLNVCVEMLRHGDAALLGE